MELKVLESIRSAVQQGLVTPLKRLPKVIQKLLDEMMMKKWWEDGMSRLQPASLHLMVTGYESKELRHELQLLVDEPNRDLDQK